MASETRIVVVGAGVSGLTTALLLSQNPSNKVTVIAKHQPGDFDIEYASPWAGANYIPVSLAGTPEEGYERDTWPYLESLASGVPQAGVHFLKNEEYFPPLDVNGSPETPELRKWRSEIEKSNPWFSKTVPNWRFLDATECPKSYPRGVAFTSVCINPQIYLPYLQSECARVGVTFRRAAISHITDAGRYFLRKQNDTLAPNVKTEQANLIVNCTGLSSFKLGGVVDKKLYPIRGQVVLVQEEVDYMVSCAETDVTQSAGDELCYVMSRAAGGGSILGGCYQIGDWNGQVDAAMSERILKRAARIIPALIPGHQEGKRESDPDDWKKLTVVRHGVGLRPARKGGVRVEKELMNDSEWKGWIVHNYGHGGYGYQASYGCALEVVKLVEQCKQVV